MNDLSQKIDQTIDELDSDLNNLKNELLEIPRGIKRIGWGAIIPITCLLAFVILVISAIW